MTNQWETSVGNLMPFVPFESFDTDAAKASVLVGEAKAAQGRILYGSVSYD